MGSAHFLVDAWKVLMLFLIPIGGGIPAGVVLASSRGIGWPVMVVLYFISDVILALLFEPLLKLLILVASYLPFLLRMVNGMKKAMQKSVARYANSTHPLTLIMISFGVDPMTGRAAALAAGHGFVSGWMIAITGDMMYFAVLMVSTLWLKSLLGDGTSAMMLILVLMIIVPMLVRRIRERRRT